MLKNLFKTFIYFPISVILTAFALPYSILKSLYETVRTLDFKKGYTFYIFMFSFSLTYIFSEFIATTSTSHLLTVLISCYSAVCLAVAVYNTYGIECKRPGQDIQNCFIKSETLFSYNNLNASLDNLQPCELPNNSSRPDL